MFWEQIREQRVGRAKKWHSASFGTWATDSIFHLVLQWVTSATVNLLSVLRLCFFWSFIGKYFYIKTKVPDSLWNLNWVVVLLNSVLLLMFCKHHFIEQTPICLTILKIGQTVLVLSFCSYRSKVVSFNFDFQLWATVLERVSKDRHGKEGYHLPRDKKIAFLRFLRANGWGWKCWNGLFVHLSCKISCLS